MKYRYKPKTKEELIKAIKKEIYEVQGTKKNPNLKADLNCIDTSLITDMSELFSYEYNLNNFNGNISKWNVSNVKNMNRMFEGSKFNQDISNWHISNVTNMRWMFAFSQFNGNISNWDVSNVENMSWMFYKSKFDQDISKWDVSNVENMESMFENSKFNGDISNWNVSNVKDIENMFLDSDFNKDIGSWPEYLKKQTDLKNISVSLGYDKLPDKIIFPETVANIFIRSVNYSDEIFNIDNFKQIFKEFLNNRKKLYKNKSYKSDIVNKLILNDIADILKHLKDKEIQGRFLEITKMMNKDRKEQNKDVKEPKINIG